MKYEIDFRKPGPTEMLELATRLKMDDVLEIQASSGCTPEQVVQKMIAQHTPATGVYEDDTLIAIFGVNEVGYTKGTAAVWMLSSEELRRHGKTLVKLGRMWLAMQQKRHGILFNMVDARATRTLAWLRRMGFRFKDVPAYGPQGMPFVMVTLGD